jgi:hypothetical protein
MPTESRGIFPVYQLCPTCDGSGTIDILEAWSAGMVIAKDYVTWCHDCEAGKAWQDAFEETPGSLPYENDCD